MQQLQLLSRDSKILKNTNVMVITVILIGLMMGLSSQQQTKVLQYNQLYSSIHQEPKSYRFYSFKTQMIGYANQYTSLRVDIDDPNSSPLVFISKTNQYPTNEFDSEQNCVKAGSQLCIIRKTIASSSGTAVYFGVRCIQACSYSIKISTQPVVTLTDGNKITQRVDPRGVQIYQYTVPRLTSEATLTENVYFTVESPYQYSPISLYSSYSDDFSLMEERELDLVVDSGKSFKIQSEDILWCSQCTIFLILKNHEYMQFQIQAQATGRRESFNDTNSISRVIRTLQTECFSYNMQRSINDLVINLKVFQGVVDFRVNTRTSDNLPSTDILISSDPYYQMQYIIRTSDRQRYVQANGLLFVCGDASSDTSFQISSTSLYSYNIFDIKEDTLTSFYLESDDYISFRFTSTSFKQDQVMMINITQSQKGSSFKSSFPAVLYKVCTTSKQADCYLSDKEAQTYSGSKMTMKLLNGTYSNNNLTRIITFNHNASSCKNLNPCYYLFSIYNPELSGEIKQSIKLNILGTVPILTLPLQSLQESQVSFGNYTYFTVGINVQQYDNMDLSSLVITLTSLNGRADLYVSTKTQYPTMNNYTYISTSLNQVNKLIIPTSTFDLRTTKISIGVYGYTQTQFRIRVDPINSSVYPPVNYMTLDPTDYDIQTPVYDYSNYSFISEFSPMLLFMNQTKNISKIAYLPTKQSVIIQSSALYKDVNSSYTFNVQYKGFKWTNLKSGTFIIDSNQTIQFDGVAPLFITIKATFNVTKTTSKNQASPSMQLSFSAFSSNKDATTDQINEVVLNKTYQTYLNGDSNLLLFKKLLMDATGTYTYTLTNTFGYPALMIRNGYSDILMQPSETDSYDNIQTVSDDFQTISVSNNLCQNGSFPIRGGTQNCTMYIGVYCSGLCIFSLTGQLTTSKNKTFQEPMLIQDMTQINGTVERNKTMFYYIPFVRNQLGDSAFLLNKLNNDSILVAKIIQNAYLPYYNWPYPTNISNDFVSRNKNLSYEIIDISASYFNSRCPNNTSCALIIGVIGNSNQNQAFSNFNLLYFNSSNKIANQTLMKRIIEDSNEMQYFWFIVNTTNSKGNYYNWSHLITADTIDENNDIDLYASIISGYLPNDVMNDYQGVNFGPDMINITTNDSVLLKRSYGPKVLIVVAVKATKNNTDFKLMNWGPSQITSSDFNYLDLTLGNQIIYTFPQRSTLSQTSYQLYRYFNYGVRDVQFNITCSEGQVYVLANNYPLRMDFKSQYLLAPIFNESSLIPPFNVSKGNSQLLRLNKDNNDTGLWCLYCWYYIAIFENSTKTSTKSTIRVTVTEIKDSGQYISQLAIGETQSEFIALSSSAIQRKFLFDTRQPFSLNVTNNNSGSMTGYIGLYSSYLENEIIWSQTANNAILLRVKQSDTRFLPGTYYYLTIVSGVNRQNISMQIKQSNTIAYLENGETLLDRMQTLNDFVKYYYFKLPNSTMNFTGQIQIRTRTPGFQPNIYLRKNDFVNTTVNYTSVVYPSLNASNIKLESLFYSLNENTTIMFNVTAQNISVNVSEAYYVNTTNKTNSNNSSSTGQTWNIKYRNVSVRVLNQTYYTIAVYWNNFGYTDYQLAEYEITYRQLPLQRASLKNQIDYCNQDDLIKRIFWNENQTLNDNFGRDKGEIIM